MTFDLQDLLEAIGPTASLVFAAWIFLSYLQARSQAAFERYRALCEDFRHGQSDLRMASVGQQLKLYRRRCELMQTATHIGVVSAILLLSTLVTAALNVVLPLEAWSWLAAAFGIGGLCLVITAAVCVLRENTLVREAIAAEVADLSRLDS